MEKTIYIVNNIEYTTLEEAVKASNYIDYNINRFAMFDASKRVDSTITTK